MKVSRSKTELPRAPISWDERWNGPDHGLIACWERGREKAIEDPELSSRARNGQLVSLPWKGGVEKAVKAKQKFGTLSYLAMWQGLRGDNLDINTEEEIKLTCTATQTMVVFTGDQTKIANA